MVTEFPIVYQNQQMYTDGEGRRRRKGDAKKSINY